MKYIVIISLSILLTICCRKNDDDNFSPGNENSTQIDPNMQNCEDAHYPNWIISNYVLPYPVGESYTVNLSHCSGSYHSVGRPDQYAIDFNMEVGTVITASREGTVVHIIESGEDYSSPNNLVVIRHNDSSFAQYMHLTKDGAIVELGDNVVKGDTIGLSGATGLAGYPHLHFVVTQNSWPYPYKSIPYNFSNTNANPKSLLSGQTYLAKKY